MGKRVIRFKPNMRSLMIALVLMLIIHIIMGVMLITMSKNAIREQIDARMLDAVNTAAFQLSGDELKRITGDDKESEEYVNALSLLRSFQQNIKLDYIYAVKINDDGTFAFLIDPDIEDPADYGEKIETTDALIKASKGTPAVDKVAVTDEWGRFYSAYAPVWDSDGNVAALVGVDFDADWYDGELNSHKAVVVILSMIALTIIIGITFISHTSVLEGEKNEYRKKLEETLLRELEQKQELGSARRLAYTDPLTGVKSKRAYLEAIERIDKGVSDGSIDEFGVIVFDLNGLKTVNDTLGHEEGDRYIKEGSAIICGTFCHSPVFRIGGDEFVVILEGTDYLKRDILIAEFEELIEENQRSGKVVVSSGMDEFDLSCDTSFSSVFERADKKMYERKCYLKTLKKNRTS